MSVVDIVMEVAVHRGDDNVVAASASRPQDLIFLGLATPIALRK